MLGPATNYLKRKLFKYSQARLEHQFQNNKWDWLAVLDELPRYSVLIGCHRYHNNGGSILDLGSGQGLLLKRFSPADYSEYMAVDYSGTALKQIECNEKIQTAEADLTTYVPPKQYDSVIFNESLYYVKNPIKQLERYMDYVTASGSIFLSIHRKNKDLVDKINDRFSVYDQSMVTNKWGENWYCLTIKKAGSASM